MVTVKAGLIIIGLLTALYVVLAPTMLLSIYADQQDGTRPVVVCDSQGHVWSTAHVRSSQEAQQYSCPKGDKIVVDVPMPQDQNNNHGQNGNNDNNNNFDQNNNHGQNGNNDNNNNFNNHN